MVLKHCLASKVVVHMVQAFTAGVTHRRLMSGTAECYSGSFPAHAKQEVIPLTQVRISEMKAAEYPDFPPRRPAYHLMEPNGGTLGGCW